MHEYYTKRPINPLKKMQSLIALCNKLIRVLFGILKKGHEFSEGKMMQEYSSICGVAANSLTETFFCKMTESEPDNSSTDESERR